LRVEVILEEFLVRSTGYLACGMVHRFVEVYWDGVHVMNGADDEIDGGMGGEGGDEGGVGGADIFAFEAD
jgi:hypothetical protein